MDIPTDLVSIKEAARIAGVQTLTLYRRHYDGKLQVWGSPKSYRVSLSDVLSKPKQRQHIGFARFPQNTLRRIRAAETGMGPGEVVIRKARAGKQSPQDTPSE